MSFGLLSGVSGATIKSGLGFSPLSGLSGLSSGLSLLSGVGGLFGGSKVSTAAASVRDTISGIGDFNVSNEGPKLDFGFKGPTYNKPIIDFSEPKEVLALACVVVLAVVVWKKYKG